MALAASLDWESSNHGCRLGGEGKGIATCVLTSGHTKVTPPGDDVDGSDGSRVDVKSHPSHLIHFIIFHTS